MRSLLNIAFASAITLLCALPSVAQNRSVYTSLDTKQCRTIKSPNADEDDLLQKCRGTAGYTLLVSEGDLRQNITVVTPRGVEHSLELWSVVSGGFSTVGPKVEWRLAPQNGKPSPVALIIRYNTSEDAEHPNKNISYLAVAKITPTEICVTEKISPSANANAEARTAADSAANRPCFKRQ